MKTARTKSRKPHETLDAKSTDSAPEVTPGAETITAWDEPPSSRGIRVSPIPSDDDEQSEALVNEGIEEADRELRLQARTDDEEDSDNPESVEEEYPREGILS